MIRFMIDISQFSQASNREEKMKISTSFFSCSQKMKINTSFVCVEGNENWT